MDEKKHVLKIRGLNVSFKTSAGVVNAVRGVEATRCSEAANLPPAMRQIIPSRI